MAQSKKSRERATAKLAEKLAKGRMLSETLSRGGQAALNEFTRDMDAHPHEFTLFLVTAQRHRVAHFSYDQLALMHEQTRNRNFADLSRDELSIAFVRELNESAFAHGKSRAFPDETPLPARAILMAFHWLNDHIEKHYIEQLGLSVDYSDFRGFHVSALPTSNGDEGPYNLYYQAVVRKQTPQRQQPHTILASLRLASLLGITPKPNHWVYDCYLNTLTQIPNSVVYYFDTLLQGDPVQSGSLPLPTVERLVERGGTLISETGALPAANLIFLYRIGGMEQGDSYQALIFREINEIVPRIGWWYGPHGWLPIWSAGANNITGTRPNYDAKQIATDQMRLLLSTVGLLNQRSGYRYVESLPEPSAEPEAGKFSAAPREPPPVRVVYVNDVEIIKAVVKSERKGTPRGPHDRKSYLGQRWVGKHGSPDRRLEWVQIRPANPSYSRHGRDSLAGVA